ncbi:hypothetical protein GCM10027591_08760 [Zhihengliuella somnathii]
MDEALTLLRIVSGGYFIWAGSRNFGPAGQSWPETAGRRITGPRGARVLAAAIGPVGLIFGLLFAAGIMPLLSALPLLALLGAQTAVLSANLFRSASPDQRPGGSGTAAPVLRVLLNIALFCAIILGSTTENQPQIPVLLVLAPALVVVAAATLYNHRVLARRTQEQR